MLIYGNPYMSNKIEQIDYKKKNTKTIFGKSPNYIDNMYLETEGRFLSVWDQIILFVVIYSCFSTIFMAAFDYPVGYECIFRPIENIVLFFFVADFILNFFRLREAQDGTMPRSHIFIMKKYAMSLWMPLDFIATFPF